MMIKEFYFGEFYDWCMSLKETTGRNDKESLLHQFKTNHTFTEVMKFLFDKNITTGIDIKKIKKVVPMDIPALLTPIETVEDLLQYVTEHNTGRDIDISNVRTGIEVISGGDKTYTEFLYEIVTKSLRLGVDSKTINKVYGYELVPTFDVQLGTSIEDVKLSGDEEIFISQKLNGTRCVYYEGRLWTRSGKTYTGCQHIIEDIKKLEDLWCTNDVVFDGELVLKSCGLSDSDAFQKGTGIANSNNETKEELEYVIFDILSKQEFRDKVCNRKYGARRASLEGPIAKTITDLSLTNIRVVPFFYRGYNHENIWKYLDYAEENDMEGIIVNLDTPYEFKRTKNLIKVKKFHDIDLRCINIEPGVKGKYRNTLGNIVCRYKDGEVRVGSGFTEEQRDYYWNHPDAIINEIVSVKYKEATKNKDGSESLQFPVFLCVREDKSEADV